MKFASSIGLNCLKLFSFGPKYAGIGDIRFGTKVGQIAIQMGQIRTFTDQMSVYFGSASQNVLTWSVKVPDLDISRKIRK